jgi:hypothetical protein
VVSTPAPIAAICGILLHIFIGSKEADAQGSFVAVEPERFLGQETRQSALIDPEVFLMPGQSGAWCIGKG